MQVGSGLDPTGRKVLYRTGDHAGQGEHGEHQPHRPRRADGVHPGSAEQGIPLTYQIERHDRRRGADRPSSVLHFDVAILRVSDFVRDHTAHPPGVASRSKVS